MITSREKGLYQIQTGLQILLVLLLYVLCAVGVLVLGFHQKIAFDAYGTYALVVAVALLVESFTRPVAMQPTLGRMRWLASQISRRQWIWIVASITIMLVFFRDQRISRTFLAVFAFFSIAVLHFSNRYLLRWLGNLGNRHTKNWTLRTCVLGPADWASSILPEIGRLHSLLEIRNVIQTDVDGKYVDQDYSELVSKEPIDLLVMPARHLPDKSVIKLMRQGDKLGYRCWMPIELSRRYGRRFNLQSVGGLDILTPPVEPLTNTWNQCLKRVFDVIFCLPIVLTVVPALSLVVWAIHRRYSPGPLFFKQDRVGRNGELFKVFKFRTLNVDHGTEARQVTKGDSRVFPGGGLLRKLSIDEIPQFINVLLGDMSVVGPRPHMAEHDDQFREIFERYGVRRYVKPGITGLAQVKGFRGEVNRPRDLRHRARLDNFYVGHWELMLDLQIVVKTGLTMVVPPKTAY